MPFCQVIKANDKWCNNYARKDMTCCWPHRKLENDTPDKVVKAVVLEDIPVEVIEVSTPWPSLEEARDEIKLFCISTLGGINSYAKAKNTLNLPKYEVRLVALTISEAILQVPIPEEAKLSVKLLLINVIKKLTEAKYNIEYVLNLLDFLQNL